MILGIDTSAAQCAVALLGVGDPVVERRVDGLTLVVEPASGPESGDGAETNQERREGDT